MRVSESDTLGEDVYQVKGTYNCRGQMRWCSVGTTRDLEPRFFIFNITHKKPQTCLQKTRGSRMRECEGKDLSRSLTVAFSLPRPRTLAFQSLSFFKTSKESGRIRYRFGRIGRPIFFSDSLHTFSSSGCNFGSSLKENKDILP